MIGDQAIRFRERHRRRYEYWDLGAQWELSARLPFVFALWLIRPEVACTDYRRLASKLRDENLRRSIGYCGASEILPAVLRALLQGLLAISFRNARKEGLSRFRSLCEKYGILQPNDTTLVL